MKSTIIIMLLFFALVINAQSEQQQDSTKMEIAFGINGGIIIPVFVEMADKILFGFGATLDIFPSKPTFSITFGADFIRDKNDMITTLFVGPSMGKDKGSYFSPAITMSFAEGVDDNIYGFDIGGGYLFDGDDVKFNIGVKLSLLNAINSEHDKLIGAGKMLIGVNF